MPGVSRNRICASGVLWMPNIRLRVVWGLFEVIAIFCPSTWLSRVDVPTLGRPTRATNPDTNGWLVSSVISSYSFKQRVLKRCRCRLLLCTFLAGTSTTTQNLVVKKNFHKKDFVMVRSFNL